jgi:hypothetical protein
MAPRRRTGNRSLEHLVANLTAGSLTAVALFSLWLFKTAAEVVAELAAAIASSAKRQRSASPVGITKRRAASPVRVTSAASALDGSRVFINSRRILQFRPANERWWQKPLVLHGGRCIPAELAVLAVELHENESGVWLNSRSTTTGVADLIETQPGVRRTARVRLPGFVSDRLRDLYVATGLPKGMPDLVVWNVITSEMRLLEVKCPHWDSLFGEQEQFLAAAAARGVPTKIVEWEFGTHSRSSA